MLLQARLLRVVLLATQACLHTAARILTRCQHVATTPRDGESVQIAKNQKCGSPEPGRWVSNAQFCVTKPIRSRNLLEIVPRLRGCLRSEGASATSGAPQTRATGPSDRDTSRSTRPRASRGSRSWRRRPSGAGARRLCSAGWPQTLGTRPRTSAHPARQGFGWRED